MTYIMEHKVGTFVEDKPLYMYILVNNDHKMGKGKIAGQVGHVVGLITEKIVTDYYEKRDTTTIEIYER